MKIGIIGNYGATNVGDEAILGAILARHKEQNFTVFSSHPKVTAKKHSVKTAPLFPFGLRSLFRHGFRRPFKALKSVDAVILGGGGLFQDDKIMACFLWAWQLFWVDFLEKPLFVYAIGVGPLKSRLGRKLTRWALSHAQIISVRDDASKELLQAIGLTEGEIHVTGDPSFLPGPPLKPADRKAHHFLISLRPWKGFKGSMLEIFTSFLLKLKTEKHATFTFVVMQEIRESDHHLLKSLMQRVGGKVLIPKSFTELLQAMKKAEFAIGMRYHFNIAALLTQTPILPISYSPKVTSLFAKMALEKYMIPIEELSMQGLEANLKRLSADYNTVKRIEKKYHEVLSENAQLTAELLGIWLKECVENKEKVDQK